MGSHLQRWGISEDRITEFDWWDSLEFGGLKFHAAPARHFSGRSVNDRNSTLWASWVFIGDSSRVYFSGDGGYSPFFKQIGETFGPFDLCMVECGQYNYRWKDIHMTPEETVQACVDLGGKKLIPIHWGAFNLAPHTWTDPAERVSAESVKQNVNLVTPLIGQRIFINSEVSTGNWWEKIKTDQ